ncbi:hypothetical protein ACE1CD_12845 [Aerosakkonema sp. BLCC-F183]|uniref:hypothetical protein n=1 Tax=Aerosakkonema sp. BLCC-F183 TaxID=3342834 RepID=UPI0035B772A1
MLNEFSVEDANIELLREGWQKVISAIATSNREAALNLISAEIWTQFTRIGIAHSPIDSPDKFISKYALIQKPVEKSIKNKSKTDTSKKKK